MIMTLMMVMVQIHQQCNALLSKTFRCIYLHGSVLIPIASILLPLVAPSAVLLLLHPPVPTLSAPPEQNNSQFEFWFHSVIFLSNQQTPEEAYFFFSLCVWGFLYQRLLKDVTYLSKDSIFLKFFKFSSVFLANQQMSCQHQQVDYSSGCAHNFCGSRLSSHSPRNRHACVVSKRVSRTQQDQLCNNKKINCRFLLGHTFGAMDAVIYKLEIKYRDGRQT